MKANKKILAYSNSANYIVCSCEISELALEKFRNDVKMSNNYDLLHKFDNMLAANDGIINLGVFTNDLIENIEKVSKVTTDFLDILEVKEKKISSLEEFSEGWRCAQFGIFGTDVENNKHLREYASSINNSQFMKSIGYDLSAKINRKPIEKRKILTANA